MKEIKTQLGERHRPSGVNTRFTGENLPFPEYVRRTVEMLRRLHAGKDDAETAETAETTETKVAGNAPFELLPLGDFQKGRTKPFRRGVLLTHGMLDSPYHMRHLAACFQRQGFRVMAVLLPGHGTRPGDLLGVDRREWARAVAYGAQCVAAEAEEVYLAGFSVGATLSVLHAALDARVCGLFLFSPALEIDAHAAWAGLHRWYSWLIPKAAWLKILPDRDPYKYESLCKNAVAQVYALTQALPHALPHALPQEGTDIPVFAAASADDTTVRAEGTLRFMRRARHPRNQLVWYATERTEEPGVEWVNSALPSRRILGSAHTAVVIPPEDPHYGENGGYANCLHYYPQDPETYASCLAGPDEMWKGEITRRNLERGLLRRLTYNPHFAAMEESMAKFIRGLP